MSNGKKKKQPTPANLKNERSNQLGNAQRHIWDFLEIKRKGAANINSKEITDLKDIVHDCIDTLQTYIDPKKHFEGQNIPNDSLCEKINKEISHRAEIDLAHDESIWLRQFHNIDNDVFHFSRDITIQSLDDIKGKLNTLESNLKLIKKTNEDTIKNDVTDYLKEIERLSLGVGIVCLDGLKHYKNQKIDCVTSIKLGLTMFFTAANYLLKMEGADVIG